MKPYALALLAIVVLTSLGIFLIARQSVPAGNPPVIVATKPTFTPPVVPRVPPPDPLREAARKEAEAARNASVNPNASVAGDARLSERRIDAAAPASDGTDDPLAAEKAIIHGLATSGNPANVPAIARFLEHESADLRQEAILGLLALGEKAGAPFLVAATVKARTQEEANMLRDAADFLNKGIKDSGLAAPGPELTNEAAPVEPAP